jgi:hypothetical protein
MFPICCILLRFLEYWMMDKVQIPSNPEPYSHAVVSDDSLCQETVCLYQQMFGESLELTSLQNHRFVTNINTE